MNKKPHFLFYLLFIIGCSNIIDEDSLIEKSSVKYSKGSQTPFTGEVIGKYDNGQDRIKGQYLDGKRHGLWILLHENGKESEKGKYLNGEKLWRLNFSMSTIM